jgi:aryl-alcohol dehydrogenase-like predicted oxidoreductase
MATIDLSPRPIGDLRVGRLVLGTMTFGEQLDEAASATVIHRARELGVTMLDTANGYCGGLSEEIVGRVVAPFRDEVQIATKVGAATAERPAGTPRIDAASIERELEGSLRRLGTDHVDLYYLHMPDHVTPIEESLAAMDRAVRAGKVRNVAMSNHPAWAMAEAVHVARANGWAPPVVGQPLYNLLARRLEDEYAECSAHHGIADLVYNPLAGGLLTGKHRGSTTPDATTRFGMRQMYRDRYWNRAQHVAIERLGEVADAAGITLIALALRWLLMRDEVTGIILGVSSLAQLEANVDAAGGPLLDAATLEACDEVWDTLRGAAPPASR